MKKVLTIIACLMFVCSLSGIAMAGSSATATVNDVSATANNSQGQDQGQTQGQDQGQSQNQNQGQVTTLDHTGINNSFNTNAKPGVSFVVPGDVQYGYLVNHYAAPQKGFEFQSLRTLLMYASLFSEGSLEAILNHSEGMIHEMKKVNDSVGPLKADEKGMRYIRVVIIGKPIMDSTLVGFASAQANDMETTSIEVMARVALDALRAGANVIQFTAEGAVLDTEAHGWGIGFNDTFATVSFDPKNSNVASGGTGYSSATAGLREKPWLQAFALLVPDNCNLKYAEK
jgi:hypothetical protein